MFHASFKSVPLMVMLDFGSAEKNLGTVVMASTKGDVMPKVGSGVFDISSYVNEITLLQLGGIIE